MFEEIHGESKTRLYRIWKNIKGRCCTPSSTHFHRYGGRGIKLCDDWLNSYQSFRDWALKSGYREDLTIDRIDINGNYNSSNCRWITDNENMILMNLHHIENSTGCHSSESKLKAKLSNRENNGKPISLTKEGIQLCFNSVGEAADALSNLLGRKRSSVYSHLKQLRSGVADQVGGWKIA